MVQEPASWGQLPARFGDHVRVRQAPETEAARIAGRIGTVYGVTTVSVTRVDVIGTASADTAVNVHFDEPNESVWLAPDLIEFVDHAAGTTISVRGVSKIWTRDVSGAWIESSRKRPIREWRWLRWIMRWRSNRP